MISHQRSSDKPTRAAETSVPEGFASVTPYLHVGDGEAALAFYERAFGARVSYRQEHPDGRLRHAEFRIFGTAIMLGNVGSAAASSPNAPRRVSLYLRLRGRRGRGLRARARGRCHLL